MKIHNKFELIKRNIHWSLTDCCLLHQQADVILTERWKLLLRGNPGTYNLYSSILHFNNFYMLFTMYRLYRYWTFLCHNIQLQFLNNVLKLHCVNAYFTGTAVIITGQVLTAFFSVFWYSCFLFSYRFCTFHIGKQRKGYHIEHSISALVSIHCTLLSSYFILCLF